MSLLIPGGGASGGGSFQIYAHKHKENQNGSAQQQISLFSLSGSGNDVVSFCIGSNSTNISIIAIVDGVTYGNSEAYNCSSFTNDTTMFCFAKAVGIDCIGSTNGAANAYEIPFKNSITIKIYGIGASSFIYAYGYIHYRMTS